MTMLFFNIANFWYYIYHINLKIYVNVETITNIYNCKLAVTNILMMIY